ncbi:MAG: hypothetical protein QNJ98_13225 [Planctomycetota bacterium]|nr:hypothetical protein [Planctomycetota bacterium]
MRTLLSRIGFGLFLAIGLVGIHAATTSADNGKPTYAPVANIKNLMNAINHEEMGLYGMMQADCKSGKLTSAQWNLMRHRAAMLAESGNILMQLDPPKGEAASWRKHAESFREAAKKLKKPMIRRKTDLVMAGLGEVQKQCDACHKAHRPE